MASKYRDRREAGRMLAEELRQYDGDRDVLVVGLPRGGIPPAYEVARRLRAELDVLVIRKLGVPGNEELAMGAVARGGVRVLNRDVVAGMGITAEQIETAARREEHAVAQRDEEYRGGRPPARMEGRTVLAVDDGLATGAGMLAAVRALRQYSPASIIAAVPVAAPDACRKVSQEADGVVCLKTPTPFSAVGAWYEDFSPVGDEEVKELLWQPA